MLEPTVSWDVTHPDTSWHLFRVDVIPLAGFISYKLNKCNGDAPTFKIIKRF